MSYSFLVSAPTKAGALEGVSSELGRVVEAQPAHAADRAAALASAEAFVGLLADPAGDQAVAVSVCGSVVWRDEGVFTSAGVSVSAYLTPA